MKVPVYPVYAHANGAAETALTNATAVESLCTSPPLSPITFIKKTMLLYLSYYSIQRNYKACRGLGTRQLKLLKIIYYSFTTPNIVKFYNII